MRMKPRQCICFWIIALGCVLSANFAKSEIAYYRILVKDLHLPEGKLPELAVDGGPFVGVTNLEPQAIVDHVDPRDGGAYVSFDGAQWSPWRWNLETQGQAALLIAAPAGKDVSGQLYLPVPDWHSLTSVHFTIPAASADPNAKTAYFEAKAFFYERRLAQNIPGAAWFRHQAREARVAMGGTNVQANRLPTNGSPGDLESTYELFSGSRAVSENLQLDRVLIPRAVDADATVPLDSIKGITVAEMDWKKLIGDKKPALDPLAALIPNDQHAIFFPSFAAMTVLVDETEKQGTPVLQYAEPRAEDAKTKQRYQRQLCLPLTGLGRMFGPKLIESIAITGSDPYLRVGSDVAVLFEPKDIESLQGLLESQMRLASEAGSEKAATVSGKVGEVAYSGFVSPNRQICAYVSKVSGSLVVTNSLAQLKRIVEVQAGKAESIETAPEYAFFRDRYPRGDASESGFVVLTDATIRRWCSPKWRIADSRRTRAAAILTEMQVVAADDLIAAKQTDRDLKTDPSFAGLDKIRVTPAGVSSSTYGSLDFMTPIIELEFDKVASAEATSYARWRDSYQQNWRNYFDPIAIRFTASHTLLGADMTITPLIAASHYSELVEISKGMQILSDSGDRHPESLLHLAIAVNGQAPIVKRTGAGLSDFVPQLKFEPFSWIGPTAGIYVDDDRIWADALNAEHIEEFLQKHMTDLPVAFYVQSTSVLKLTLFLTAVHGFVDQSSPGMVTWETIKYKEMSYAKIAPTAQAKADLKDLGNAAIYYSTAGGTLLVTPNEALLQRSLDRIASRAAAKADPPAAKKDAVLPSWLGQSYCLQVGGKNLIAMLTVLEGEVPGGSMQAQAWSNLYILNEWKRRYPDQDPVDVHEKLWQVRLVDPAGGKYVWNESQQTMESTVYGCPQAPKKGPKFPAELETLDRANLGVTFEGQGLRAKVELYHRDAKAAGKN